MDLTSNRKRHGPMKPHEREALARIVSCDRKATYREIRERFVRETGRDVSRPTVVLARKAAKAEIEVPTSVPPTQRPGEVRLTEAQRVHLREMIRERPDATAKQIARLFEHRTGVAVSRSTVSLYRLGKIGRGDNDRHNLTDSQRDLLLSIIREAGPEYCRSQIAREFEQLAGRSISATSVAAFLREKLNAPTLARGTNSGVGRRVCESRIRGAIATKPSTVKVDRSPRVGRSGRVRGAAS